MRKGIIFVLIAVAAVSFSMQSFAAPKFLKEAKEKVTKKDNKKKDEKKKASASAAANVVLAKGVQVNGCSSEVTDDGTITIEALKNGITITVKNGKFDLVLPSNPVFGDERELYNAAEGDSEPRFGSVKVYRLNAVDFANANAGLMTEQEYYQKNHKRMDQGRGYLSFDIYYSESDVTGTIQGEPVTLKKGWNIVGDKTNLYVRSSCSG
jgi:hypothetical protein